VAIQVVEAGVRVVVSVVVMVLVAARGIAAHQGSRRKQGS